MNKDEISEEYLKRVSQEGLFELRNKIKKLESQIEMVKQMK